MEKDIHVSLYQIKTNQMIPDDIFLKIIRSAVKAPSGHNTQPWLFASENDGICIKPNFSRSLPVADPDHRELFISLGCAAETAIIAARFYGYNAELNMGLLEKEGTIEIIMSKNEYSEQPELFSFINLRQTTRNLYNDRSVSDYNLVKLTEVNSESGCNVRLHSGSEEINKFLPYIFEANAIQMSKPDFKNELIHWLRFSEKEAMQKGDGLNAACMGIPSLGRTAGSFLLRNFVTVKSEEKRLLKQVHQTALMATFSTQNNTIVDWVKTGMVLQRFALTAIKLGLSLSYMNMPCQIPPVRDKMLNELGLAGIPQLLIRLGYSNKMHFSFRRRINDVIIRQEA
jgi:hypothetical protein